MIKKDNRKSNNENFATLIPPKKIKQPNGQEKYVYHKKTNKKQDNIIQKTIERLKLEEKYECKGVSEQ